MSEKVPRHLQIGLAKPDAGSAEATRSLNKALADLAMAEWQQEAVDRQREEATRKSDKGPSCGKCGNPLGLLSPCPWPKWSCDCAHHEPGTQRKFHHASTNAMASSVEVVMSIVPGIVMPIFRRT